MIATEPDITRLLGRLKALDLIEQHRDSEDRRVVWTQIAAKGLELLKEMDPVIQRVPIELLGHMEREDLQRLIGLLEQARTQVAE